MVNLGLNGWVICLYGWEFERLQCASKLVGVYLLYIIFKFVKAWLSGSNWLDFCQVLKQRLLWDCLEWASSK